MLVRGDLSFSSIFSATTPSLKGLFPAFPRNLHPYMNHIAPITQSTAAIKKH